MAQTRTEEPVIKVDGKSWVIDLPDDFSAKNKLAKGTQVLLTFMAGDHIEAEILPPLPPDIAKAAAKVLKRRRGAYEELKRIGD